jgi:hypothetical protein
VPFIVSCEKDENDFRDAYIGEYNFSINLVKNSFEYDVDPSRGHFALSDTITYYLGSVEKATSDADKIIVNWGKNSLDAGNGILIEKQNTIFSIYEGAILKLEHLDDMDEVYFSGLIQGDTIKFSLAMFGGMAHQLYSDWSVVGTKN